MSLSQRGDSDIRETMVKLMVTPGAVYNRAEAGEVGTTVPEKACGTGLGIIDPSACVFWCAVALGAIVKGSPVESVSQTGLHRCPERQI